MFIRRVLTLAWSHHLGKKCFYNNYLMIIDVHVILITNLNSLWCKVMIPIYLIGYAAPCPRKKFEHVWTISNLFGRLTSHAWSSIILIFISHTPLKSIVLSEFELDWNKFHYLICLTLISFFMFVSCAHHVQVFIFTNLEPNRSSMKFDLPWPWMTLTDFGCNVCFILYSPYVKCCFHWVSVWLKQV